MAYKPYADLTAQQKQLFTDEAAYKSFMEAAKPPAPTTKIFLLSIMRLIIISFWKKNVIY